jgi:tetratricopeptide (TPR) repeat protein
MTSHDRRARVKRAAIRAASWALGLVLLLTTPLAHAQVGCSAAASPPSPVSTIVCDERLASRAPRAKALLVVELRGLENLLVTTPPASPDRAALLRRLAEDYVELESSVLSQQDTSVAESSRRSAEERYATLRDSYPESPTHDEVLYFLAYEYERGGDLANARRAYFTLIQSRPQSTYVPKAYLAFGDMFFADATSGDPSKYPLAEQAYQKVIAYPPPRNHAYGYAWFKVAHVYWREGEPAKALQAFQKVKEWAVSFAGDPTVASVGSAAQHDLAVLRAACPGLAVAP